LITSYQYGTDMFRLLPEASRPYSGSIHLYVFIMAFVPSQLLPLVTVENDDSVAVLVKNTCAIVAHTSFTNDVIPVAISALEKVHT